MALRTRQNRMNSKEMFFRDPKTIQDDEKPNEKPKPKKSSQESSNVSSKSTQQLPGNLISFAEFSKLVDASSEKQSNCFSKTSGKKSNGSIKSHIPLKTKSPAPPPPVQRTSNEKVLKKGDAVSVKVPAKDYKKELTQPNLPASVDRKDSEGQVNKAKQLDAQESVPRSPTIHCETETADGKTVVRLNSSFEDKAESFTVDGKKASITIHTKNIVDESKPEAERKTSVIISKFHPQDTNKVRINVTNEPNDAESSSSTCTIIETGSNSTVIPVVSTDNKTTLIVGSNTPMTSPKTPNDTEPVQFAFSSAPNNGTSKFEQPSRYIFSTMQSEADKDITMMDPVEAIRRNLVPHICGKENGVSLMEKIKQLRETKEQINLKPISQVSAKSENAENTSVVGQPTESLISSLKSKKTKSKNFPAEEDSSTATSRSNSFCSTLNSSGKNSSTNTSRSNSFRSNYCKGADTDFCGNQNSSLMEPKGKFYILSDTEDATDQEKDKLECEYEIRNGFKENENIYEIIKEEPIYDRIESKTDNDESEDEVPPPLPLTAPPTFEEVERQRSTTKSIFEGASKYDILNYLVDAKERVQEESYFSGSSIGEEHEGKRLNSLEESEKEFINNVANSSTTRDFERKANESRSNPEINGSELDVKSKLNQLNYLSEDNLTSSSPEKETQKLIRKSSAEIERNDSGVGSETSHTSRSKWQVSSSIRENPQHLCEDCDQLVETQITDG